MNKAVDDISFFAAGMGGTEIYEPIKFAIDMKIDE